jgi:geranylgeranyl diphosphate synthase type II
LAFQIADDILDVTSQPTELGKPTGADASAGRFTFPAVLGLDHSKTLAAERIEHAVFAVSRLEDPPGPLAALARFSVERRV